MSATARVRRRQTVRLVIALIWLLPVWFFGYFALDLGVAGEPIPAGQRIVYGAIAAVFAVLAVRTFRIAVVTGPDGVRVRGVLRSWTLRWDEIERFEWGRWRGWGDYPCGVVRRRDGSAVTVFALNPPFEFANGQDRRIPDLLDELNDELGQARGIPAPDAGAPLDPDGLARERSAARRDRTSTPALREARSGGAFPWGDPVAHTATQQPRGVDRARIASPNDPAALGLITVV